MGKHKLLSHEATKLLANGNSNNTEEAISIQQSAFG